MIVLGSKAMLVGLGEGNKNERYEKSDYDVIMSYEDFVKWNNFYGSFISYMYPTSSNKYRVKLVKDGVSKIYEIELDGKGSSSKLLLDNVYEVCEGELSGFLGESYNILKLEYLTLTKKSHLIYPVHFEKSINDYGILKSSLGDFERNELMIEYLNIRSLEAKNRYNQRTPNLNVSTEDFFSSKLNVPHFYVHDDIHEVMAHNERPIFTMMQSDPDSAWCEKDMFFDLSYDYQIQCVQEEAYVIALERYIIPQYGDDCNNYFNCYMKALKRICTTLTSGWFREFAIENYDEIVKRYNTQFVKKFNDAVDNGQIRKLV